MSRPFLFGTNFKMNQTPEESARFFDHLAGSAPPPGGVQRFLIPPFTSLQAVTDRKRSIRSGADVWIGAQNMHWEAAGAFTGEVSAPMLTALGVDFVLLGHAERRGLFHETDQALNKKVAAALAAGLRVLLCVGETAEEKGYDVGPETVARQLKIALHGLPAEAPPLLQIAYEPVWSIGAGGTPAEPATVEPVARHLRALLVERFGSAGGEIPVLYGGSVDPGNAGIFAAIPEIGGLFVGRAAWTVEGYLAVLDAALSGRTA